MFSRYARNARAFASYLGNTCSALRTAAMVVILGLSSVSLVPAVQAQAQSQPAEVATAQLHNQVNINTADAETLALALDGVGMSKARDIVAHREQNGAFKTVDDLQNVRGIGKATLERNRERILVETSDD